MLTVTVQVYGKYTTLTKWIFNFGIYSASDIEVLYFKIYHKCTEKTGTVTPAQIIFLSSRTWHKMTTKDTSYLLYTLGEKIWIILSSVGLSYYDSQFLHGTLYEAPAGDFHVKSRVFCLTPCQNLIYFIKRNI